MKIFPYILAQELLVLTKNWKKLKVKYLLNQDELDVINHPGCAGGICNPPGPPCVFVLPFNFEPARFADFLQTS